MYPVIVHTNCLYLGFYCFINVVEKWKKYLKGTKTKILYKEQLWSSLNLDLKSIQAISSNACVGLAESSVTPICACWRSGFTALNYIQLLVVMVEKLPGAQEHTGYECISDL